MDEGLIARRYAKAVFRYAQELNAADAVYDEIIREKLYRSSRLAESFVKSVVITRG